MRDFKIIDKTTGETVLITYAASQTAALHNYAAMKNSRIYSFHNLQNFTGTKQSKKKTVFIKDKILQAKI